MNTIIHLLKSCASAAHILQIQTQLIINHHHIYLNSTVAHHFITACRSLSLINSAHLLYTRHLHFKPHVFICNTLLKSLPPHTSISFYSHMFRASIVPNNYTFPIVLKSLSNLKDFNCGQAVHTNVMKLGHVSDIYINNSLLNVYASCGEMGLCRQVFDEMSQRDVVSWTVMITGYKQCGRFSDALLMFEQMQYAGVAPNHVTMVNALSTCASCGDVNMGVWIHEFIKRETWKLDVILGTALVDMYGKCGRVDDALKVFVNLEDKNVYTWNSLIKGLLTANNIDNVLWWFAKMEQEKDIKPDEVTLVVVLSACAYSGLVEIGREIFSSLANGKYGFLPNAKHYACFVDLLARSGRLKEAMEVIKGMPFEPSKGVWGALLAGCRAHGDLEMCEFAAWNVIKLSPNDRACYDILCSLYTDMGKWRELEKVRVLMNVRGIKNDLEVAKMEPKYMLSY
ncbi:pentatricopeptide repeat-containing protein At1g77170, mitochondrial-like [Rutidosis leptorrhynchoides]|uniref:pentatricopeptide repeat-containing protein At1g77170, mitochondrial-like n=1 Tax=Rutidosis leptorrhynchoides TaxID=125765 RepID=UPI003A996AD7